VEKLDEAVERLVVAMERLVQALERLVVAMERLVEAVRELGPRPSHDSSRECKSACTVEAVRVSTGQSTLFIPFQY
jgi:hypothetical protein